MENGLGKVKLNDEYPDQTDATVGKDTIII